MGRFGIEFVASPRHADGVVMTGPLTKAMAQAAKLCFDAVPIPKLYSGGACAISGEYSKILRKSIEHSSHRTISIYTFGDAHRTPLTFITGILDWLDRESVTSHVSDLITTMSQLIP